MLMSLGEFVQSFNQGKSSLGTHVGLARGFRGSDREIRSRIGRFYFSLEIIMKNH